MIYTTSLAEQHCPFFNLSPRYIVLFLLMTVHNLALWCVTPFEPVQAGSPTHFTFPFKVRLPWVSSGGGWGVGVIRVTAEKTEGVRANRQTLKVTIFISRQISRTPVITAYSREVPPPAQGIASIWPCDGLKWNARRWFGGVTADRKGKENMKMTLPNCRAPKLLWTLIAFQDATSSLTKEYHPLASVQMNPTESAFLSFNENSRQTMFAISVGLRCKKLTVWGHNNRVIASLFFFFFFNMPLLLVYLLQCKLSEQRSKGLPGFVGGHKGQGRMCR